MTVKGTGKCQCLAVHTQGGGGAKEYTADERIIEKLFFKGHSRIEAITNHNRREQGCQGSAVMAAYQRVEHWQRKLGGVG